MQSISKKKSTTTKKIDMAGSIDEQYRKEGRHKIVVPRSTPNVKTEPVNKPKTPDLKSTEERMKKHVERVMEQLRASSAFLGLSQLDEKKLTPAEKKKREEIAQAIERKNPGMDMGRKMAIATAQAKKVAEEVELDEKVLATHNDVTVHNVGDGEIHVRKNGKTIAHGDYDHEGGGFWISHHSHKGQKGFNKPDEIAKHYHSVHESEEKERDYIVVHAKKGTHKTTAKTSYEAAKKAASHWRLKSTAGIDAHPAKSDRFMYEESELDESMENLSLKQWSKIHRDHHEFGGGSKASQRKMSQIEKHVHKKYGKEAMHKMIKDTEDYASGGGSGPVRESAVSSADFKLDKTGRKYPAHRIKTADDEAPFEGGRTIKSKKSADERVGKIAKGMMKQYTKEAVQDATTPSNAQETIMKSGGVKALAQSIKAKKKSSDKFDPNPEFVSQVQPNASNY